MERVGREMWRPLARASRLGCLSLWPGPPTRPRHSLLWPPLPACWGVRAPEDMAALFRAAAQGCPLEGKGRLAEKGELLTEVLGPGHVSTGWILLFPSYK